MAEKNDASEAMALLLWARASGFRVRSIDVGGIKMEVDDLQIGSVASPAPPGPRTIHEAWAKDLGIKLPPDEDDDDERPS